MELAEIRRVTYDDIPRCVTVIRESFATVAAEFGITPENAPRFTAFATDAARLGWQLAEGRPMFAYTENGVIVGYYSLHVQGAECELNNLSVLPAYRHGKRGEALLLHAMAEAKACGCMRMNLGIVEENTRLRDWYARYGFVHTGTKKFDFFPFTCGYMTRELQEV